MLLKELFEAPSKEVSIIFGRFNPPHKGHKAAWELASKSPIWYVGTNKSTQGPKDPLPFDVKIQAMEAIWPEVAKHIVAEQSWLTLASMVYEKHGDVVLYILTDEEWVTKTILQYNGKESNHGFYNFSKIEKKATPRLSSATALRDAVMKGDRDAFADAAGVSADLKVAGKPFFNLVAEYLLPYANAPKKTKKKAESVEEANVISSPEDTLYLKQVKNLINTEMENALSPVEKEALIMWLDGATFKEIAQQINKTPAWASRLVYRGIWKVKRRLKVKKLKKSSLSAFDTREDAAGVGIITKQNTTGDVNKGSIRKNLKAFKL